MKRSSGFSIALVIAIILCLAIAGFAGWRIYDVLNRNNNQSPSEPITQPTEQPEPEPKPKPTNLITKYFEPADVSFSFDKSWKYENHGLQPGYFAGQPNLRSVSLRKVYKSSSDDVPSNYTISFSVDTKKPNFESYINRFKKLGEVKLGSQKLYILKAYYDPGHVGFDMNSIVTSACVDRQCEFKLTNTNLYFEVGAIKAFQNGAPLDEVMVPKIVKILKTMKLKK